MEVKLKPGDKFIFYKDVSLNPTRKDFLGKVLTVKRELIHGHGYGAKTAYITEEAGSYLFRDNEIAPALEYNTPLWNALQEEE